MLPAQHGKVGVMEELPLPIHQGEVKDGELVLHLPEGTSKRVFAPRILIHQTQTQGAAPIQTHRQAILGRKQITNSPGTRRFANFSAL